MERVPSITVEKSVLVPELHDTPCSRGSKRKHCITEAHQELSSFTVHVHPLEVW